MDEGHSNKHLIRNAIMYFSTPAWSATLMWWWGLKLQRPKISKIHTRRAKQVPTSPF